MKSYASPFRVVLTLITAYFLSLSSMANGQS